METMIILALTDTQVDASIFLLAFLFSSFAGVASVLRSKQEICVKTILSAFLNSGFAGLAVCLVWYLQYRQNIYFLLGICVLIGLGGPASVEFILAIFRKTIESQSSLSNPKFDNTDYPNSNPKEEKTNEKSNPI